MIEQHDVSAESKERSFLKIVVFVITGVYFFVNFHRSVIPGPIFTTLQTEFNTTGVWITALGAAFMYVYAVSQLFVGNLVDRFGGLRTILAGGTVFCIGAFILPFTSSLWGIYISRVLLGIGASSIYLSMVAVIRRVFPETYPTILGAALMIGYFGTMTANGPFVMLSDAFGWRYPMMGAGLLLASVFALLIILACKVSYPPIFRERISLAPFLEILKAKYNYSLFIISAIPFGIYMVVFTVCGKKFLEDFCGMGDISSGIVMTGIGAASAFASLFSPILCRMTGGRRKPFILFIGLGSFIPLCVITAAVFFDFRNWILSSAMFIILTMAANFGPVYISLLGDMNPKNRFGIALSFSNFFSYAAVALFGSAAGFLMDFYPPEIIDNVKIYSRDSYLLLFGVFSLLCSAVCYFSVKFKYQNN